MKNFKWIISGTALCAILAGAGHAQGKAAPFQIEDQFKKSYDVKFPAQKPTVLVFAYKEDTVWAQAKKWQLAFKTGLQDKADVRTVVILGNYMSPIRSIVKAHMKDQGPLLLDWGGKVGEAYKFDAKGTLPKIVIIDAGGEIISSGTERFTQDGYDRLSKLILKEPVSVSANEKDAK